MVQKKYVAKANRPGLSASEAKKQEHIVQKLRTEIEPEKNQIGEEMTGY